jgi:hypothetical protein
MDHSYHWYNKKYFLPFNAADHSLVFSFEKHICIIQVNEDICFAFISNKRGLTINYSEFYLIEFKCPRSIVMVIQQSFIRLIHITILYTRYSKTKRYYF